MHALKSKFRELVPHFLVKNYRRLRRFSERKQNLQKTTEEVFTDIYRENRWGGIKGEFYSGAGSGDDIVSAYISAISSTASHEGFLNATFVDLGCGDFSVGQQLLPMCSMYIGVDIVKPLIQNNKEKYENNKTHFQSLDIVEDPLPNGDVCFVRQVFQHLSNRQVSAVLQKLGNYRWVFITEHYPTDNEAIQPNTDKTHGSDIRVYANSGVYLCEPPFNLPVRAIEQIIEIPGTSLGEGNDAGVIRTFLYKPQAHS
jgi:hypothetical protein